MFLQVHFQRQELNDAPPGDVAPVPPELPNKEPELLGVADPNPPNVDGWPEADPNAVVLEPKPPNVFSPEGCTPIAPNVGAFDTAPNVPNVGTLLDEVPPNTVPGEEAPNVGLPVNDGDIPKDGAPPNAVGIVVALAGEPPNVGAAPNAGAPV